MEIRGNPLNVNAADFYSVDGTARSAAAERAAQARKRLLQSDSSIEAILGPEDALEQNMLIRSWLTSPDLADEPENNFAPGPNPDLA